MIRRCSKCSGTGVQFETINSGAKTRLTMCPQCKGTGKVDDDERES